MLSLASWKTGDRLPSAATKDALEQALAQAQDRIEPCDAKAFAVLIDGFLKFTDTFGVKRGDTGAVIEQYRSVLTIPADLLHLAIERCRRTWTWGNRLPFPAELVELVGDELSERRHDVSTLKAALGNARRAGPAQIGRVAGPRPGPEAIAELMAVSDKLGEEIAEEKRAREERQVPDRLRDTLHRKTAHLTGIEAIRAAERLLKGEPIEEAEIETEAAEA